MYYYNKSYYKELSNLYDNRRLTGYTHPDDRLGLNSHGTLLSYNLKGNVPIHLITNTTGKPKGSIHNAPLSSIPGYHTICPQANLRPKYSLSDERKYTPTSFLYTSKYSPKSSRSITQPLYRRSNVYHTQPQI